MGTVTNNLSDDRGRKLIEKTPKPAPESLHRGGTSSQVVIAEPVNAACVFNPCAFSSASEAAFPYVCVMSYPLRSDLCVNERLAGPQLPSRCVNHSPVCRSSAVFERRGGFLRSSASVRHLKLAATATTQPQQRTTT